MNSSTPDSRARILQLIRNFGPISRVELANKTGLSRSAVTSISQELYNASYIKEVSTGLKNTGRGRPRQGLAVKAKTGYFIGIKLSLHQICCVIADFSGHPVGQATHPFNGNMSPLRCIMLIDDLVTEALSEHNIQPDKVMRMCVGIPGYVSHASGYCYWSPVFDRRDVMFAELLNSHFQFDCIIENDANLATLAEHYFGNAKKLDTFCVISIEHGVGMGLLVNGALYRGHKGIGPEFGHSKLSLEGRECRCGQKGCVEAYVGDFAILHELDSSISIEDYKKDPKSHYEMAASVTQRADNGERAAIKALTNAGYYLGRALGNLIATLNPSTIILTGDGTRRNQAFFDAARKEFLAQQLVDNDLATQLIVSEWGDDIWARGATALALSVTYDEIASRFSGRQHPTERNVSMQGGVKQNDRRGQKVKVP